MAKSNSTKIASTGICNFCQGEFEKGKMTQHLKHCKPRQAVIQAEETGKSRKPKKSKLFHILVEGKEFPMYWMHLEMPASLTLDDLDDFLRGIWLECCGHLSEFRIGNISYASATEDDIYGDPFLLSPDGEAEAEAGPAEDEEDEEEETPLPPVPPEIQARFQELVQAEFPNKEVEITPLELLEKLRGIFSKILEPGPNALSLSDQTRAEVKELINEFDKQIMLASLFETVEDNFPQERDMDVTLDEALKVGQKFTHEYDFGSTTYLSLKVLSEREGVAHKGQKAIQMLARNNPPVISCVKCGQPAVVCEPGYYSAWDSALCENCAKSVDSEWSYEEMMPIVNSPRTGVCGYTGD
jgi:hypothetical protein